uniref:Uncharacterized protein n=1 Tax=Romanomermis culicivorax TaxID=13658 RepID=A0A915JVD9_ROMCU
MLFLPTETIQSLSMKGDNDWANLSKIEQCTHDQCKILRALIGRRDDDDDYDDLICNGPENIGLDQAKNLLAKYEATPSMLGEQGAGRASPELCLEMLGVHAQLVCLGTLALRSKYNSPWEALIAIKQSFSAPSRLLRVGAGAEKKDLGTQSLGPGLAGYFEYLDMPRTNISSHLTKIYIWRQNNVRYISFNPTNRKYIEEAERTIYLKPESRERAHWSNSTKHQRVVMSFRESRLVQVLKEKSNVDRNIDFLDDYNDSSPKFDETRRNNLDLDHLRSILELLKFRKVDRNFDTLCRVVLLCHKDYECCFTFVNECSINWYDSLIASCENEMIKGYMIASVFRTLAAIDKNVDSDLLFRNLKFHRIQKLASYALTDTANMNATNYQTLIKALFVMYQKCADKVLKQDFSPQFRRQLVDIVPLYLKGWKQLYSKNEAAKFDVVNFFFALHTLKAPKPDENSISTFKEIILEEFSSNFHEKDSQYYIKSIFNYLSRTYAVTESYLQISGQLKNGNFYENWNRRLINALKTGKLPQAKLAIKFYALLLRNFLLNVLIFDAERTLAENFDLYVDSFKICSKLLTHEEIKRLIEIILCSRKSLGNKVDWNVIVDCLKSSYVVSVQRNEQLST